MKSCDFVLFISALACNIVEGKTEEEIAVLAALFTQLGDTLATIVTFNNRKEFLKNNINDDTNIQ
ncbi:MAG: hypothetical protein HUJ68_02050 [Clostridia bacterium]|nr:hypothetical protein [Clostridia bacterium]